MKKFKVLFFWISIFTTDTAYQLLMKTGADQLRSTLWYQNYAIMLAFGCQILSFLVWMQIIKVTRLSMALAMTAFLYVTVELGSYLIIHEPIHSATIVGTLFIMAGVGLLGIQEGKRSK